jgi:hypothetical protein
MSYEEEDTRECMACCSGSGCEEEDTCRMRRRIHESVWHAVVVVVVIYNIYILYISDTSLSHL